MTHPKATKAAHTPGPKPVRQWALQTRRGGFWNYDGTRQAVTFGSRRNAARYACDGERWPIPVLITPTPPATPASQADLSPHVGLDRSHDGTRGGFDYLPPVSTPPSPVGEVDEDTLIANAPKPLWDLFMAYKNTIARLNRDQEALITAREAAARGNGARVAEYVPGVSTLHPLNLSFLDDIGKAVEATKYFQQRSNYYESMMAVYNACVRVGKAALIDPVDHRENAARDLALRTSGAKAAGDGT